MTISEQDEREARLWLAHAENRQKQNIGKYKYVENDDVRHRATILALLDRRVMPRPEDVEEIVFWKAAEATGSTRSFAPYIANAYRVIYDHYNPQPEPVKVEAWGIAAPTGEIIHVRATEDAARQRAQHCPDDVRIVRLVEADQ